jgi:quinol monooxygenase YgiN
VADEGSVEYRYATDVQDPNPINNWDHTASEEAMNAHMGTSHLADFMGVMGTCIGGPLEITRHDVATSTKIF